MISTSHVNKPVVKFTLVVARRYPRRFLGDIFMQLLHQSLEFALAFIFITKLHVVVQRGLQQIHYVFLWRSFITSPSLLYAQFPSLAVTSDNALITKLWFRSTLIARFVFHFKLFSLTFKNLYEWRYILVSYVGLSFHQILWKRSNDVTNYCVVLNPDFDNWKVVFLITLADRNSSRKHFSSCRNYRWV